MLTSAKYPVKSRQWLEACTRDLMQTCLLATGFFLAIAAVGETPSARVIVVESNARNGLKQTGLGDWLTVKAEGLSKSQQDLAKDNAKVVLFLKKIPLRGLCSYSMVESNGFAEFRFHLERTDATRPVWAALMGEVTRLESQRIPVSVGFEGNLALASDAEIGLLVIRKEWFWVCLALTVSFMVAVWLLARTSETLRDDGPAPPKGKLRPYSLARCQMAFWFVLVVLAYVFLWLVTGAHDTLTESVLVLMGVSASTAVFSHEQYSGKQSKSDLLSTIDELQRRQQELQANPQRAIDQQRELDRISIQLNALIPVSESFINDVLKDDVGMSFHRFQMFVWTILMGIIFLNEVWRNLSMPDFSTTVLGLMGISSGTYLGFMLIEPPPSKQEDKPKPDTK